jgi:DNA invertase Pin-like site-specific DNA recombinase
LDRLSRDIEFIAKLQKSSTKFVCADMPEANELTIGLLAVVAQHERQAISARTKAALAAAKARGTRLGNPNGAAAIRHAGKGNAASVVAIKTAANGHAANLAPIIADIRRTGITSFKAIARELNSRDILTARGGRWHPTTVKNLLARITE